MKSSKISDAQIAFVLKQAKGGTTVGEVCRKTGTSERRFTPIRRACIALRAERSSYRYRGRLTDQADLKKRMRDIA